MGKQKEAKPESIGDGSTAARILAAKYAPVELPNLPVAESIQEADGVFLEFGETISVQVEYAIPRSEWENLDETLVETRNWLALYVANRCGDYPSPHSEDAQQGKRLLAKLTHLCGWLS